MVEIRQQVILLGELSLALSAIAAFTTLIIRYFAKRLDKRIETHLRKLDDHMNELDRRTQQLIRNGGSTLADLIHRLEVRQLNFKNAVEEIAEELAEQKKLRIRTVDPKGQDN